MTAIFAPEQTPLRYDPLVQALHWVVAILVVTAYAIGLIREDLPRNEFRAFLLSLHMWIGQAVMLLTMLRLARRAATRAPAPAAHGSALAALAARLGHLALYVCLVAIPLIGLMAAFAKGRDVSLFGLVALPSPMAIDKPFAETLEEVHSFAAHAMMILALGHAVVALAHHFVLKDGLLLRMAPRRVRAQQRG
jgi:cytochrome b561